MQKVTYQLVAAILVLFASAAFARGNSMRTEPDDDDIVARSKENSAEAERDLAEAEKGVDDDGEKTWKQEAREFFDFTKNPKNRTFEMPVDWAKKFIDAAYKAGAEQVWVTGIEEFDIDDKTKLNISDTLVVVLPQDAAKRKAVFDAYNASIDKDDDEMKLQDVGQKYLYVEAD